mgnify:CR=1 FL=1|jgi:hypothetical protein
MARGPKRHLKRLNAPRHWMLDKLGGVWAPRPSTGPHKLRECLPLIILLRNRLKYALNTKEVKYVLMQRLIKVDGKPRTDKTYPAGFMGARRSPSPPAPLLPILKHGGLPAAAVACCPKCRPLTSAACPPT